MITKALCFLFGATLACLLVLTAMCMARPMGVGGNAFPTPAASAFCSSSSLCVPHGATRIKLTAEVQSKLDEVNKRVNRSIVAKNDVGDRWNVYPRAGDCEDYALTKKAELIKAGLPSASLLITIVTNGAIGHAVLTVTTDKGDLILDNLTNSIRSWQWTPYHYYQRQDQIRPRKWRIIT